MTTPATSASPESERLARLEGAYEHLATKADLAEMRAELRGEMTELRVELARTETRLLLRLGSIVVVAIAVATAITRFVG